MRGISFTIGILCLLALTTAAQEVPRGEVFLGYSYMRTGTASQVNAFNNNGGLGDLQFNVNEYLSVVAEFGGYHAGNVSISGPDLKSVDQTYFSYQFGPRFSLNKLGRIVPFGHFLLGGVHQSRSFTVPNSTTRYRSSQNAYAMTLGGGFDVNLNRTFAVRPFQLDWLPTHFSPFNVPGMSSVGINNDTRWQHNLRFSAGLGFRFGQDAGPNTR